MSIQPPHDLLAGLRAMRDKIESDPAPRTPSLQQLHAILLRRIAELETNQALTNRGGLGV
jgi:hypothetical protein